MNLSHAPSKTANKISFHAFNFSIFQSSHRPRENCTNQFFSFKSKPKLAWNFFFVAFKLNLKSFFVFGRVLIKIHPHTLKKPNDNFIAPSVKTFRRCFSAKMFYSIFCSFVSKYFLRWCAEKAGKIAIYMKMKTGENVNINKRAEGEKCASLGFSQSGTYFHNFFQFYL